MTNSTKTVPAQLGRSVKVKILTAAFAAVGAAVDAPRSAKSDRPNPPVPKPVELSPAFGLAVEIVRHLQVEEHTPQVWRDWPDSFTAHVGNAIAEVMDRSLSGYNAPVEVAAEMRLADSAALTDPIRREIAESTTSLEYLSRQWIERAMLRIVRQYFLDANSKEQQQWP